MGDDVISGVIDTIDSANQHKLRLTELLSSLKEAKTQVQTSSAKSSTQLQEHFEELKSQIITLLDTRFATLQAQISDIETRALVPLTQCEAVIEKDIAVASHILQQGKSLLGGDHESNQTDMIDYKSKANEMGLTSLPEVPPLSEVPCIFLETPDVLRKQLLTDVGDYGRILSRAPVQISSVVERPGSLVIKWAQVDDEDSQDLSEFCLQYHLTQPNGDSPGAPHEVNVGATTCYTLRHISPMKSYTFNVKGRAEGSDAAWSPWSVPYAAMTTIPHYEWKTNVDGYTLSRENKIAERLPTPEGEVLLFSQGSAYTCGQSVIFRVVECGDGARPGVVESDRPALEEGLALTVSDEDGSLLRCGAIFVSADGSVFLDGQEKLTKLPALKRGSIVTFDTEVLTSGKVRVTVEVDEKIVTFDWSIEKSKTSSGGGLLSAISQSQSQETIDLFFAMRFSTEGWRIGVE